MTSDSTTIPRNVPTLLGTGPAMLSLRQAIDIAARTTSSVLILGETGAGKEVVARLIHEGSDRRCRSFTAVNCSGIPETLLESELFGSMRGSFTDACRDRRGLAGRADRGTLFLDEVGEMTLRMQAVLLRFADTGEVQTIGAEGGNRYADVRLICATNRNLIDRIDSGEFRRDLYYRLNIIEIHVPALREHREDIVPLLEHYVDQASASYQLPVPRLSAAAGCVLTSYQWPGNVRQLKNVAERLVVHAFDRPIVPSDLPVEVFDAVPPQTDGSAADSVPFAAGDANSVSFQRAELLWQRLISGEEDFWTIVHRPFKAHQLTREDIGLLVRRGLEFTHGSYRSLLSVFGLPATDYKRFHAFLHHQSDTPVSRYRTTVAFAREAPIARTAGPVASAPDRRVHRACNHRR